MFKRILIAVTMILGLAGVARAEVFTIDKTHSNVGFSVKHLGISRVHGSFNDFSGTVTYDPADTAGWSCEAVIQMASVDTRDSSRDGHLKSSDFFDVEKHPTMTFKSTKVTPRGEGRFAVEGNLTLRGVTKQVSLDAEVLGTVESERGQRIGFSAKTRIDRMDYGVSWNNVLESGGLVVSHEVGIILEIEAAAKK